MSDTIANTHIFTLGQAAQEIGLAKSTVHSAIKSGKLSASKVDGIYEIQAAELFRVWPKGKRKKEPESAGPSLVQQAVLEVKLEASERENSMLKTQIKDALSERDLRRAEVEKKQGELEKEQAKTAQLMLDYDGEKTAKNKKPGAWILGVILLVLVAAVAVLFADRLGLISVLF